MCMKEIAELTIDNEGIPFGDKWKKFDNPEEVLDFLGSMRKLM